MNYFWRVMAIMPIYSFQENANAMRLEKHLLGHFYTYDLARISIEMNVGEFDDEKMDYFKPLCYQVEKFVIANEEIALTGEIWISYDCPIASYLFSADGKCIDSYMLEIPLGEHKFQGRDKQAIRFQVRDSIEYIDGSYLKKGTVIRTPPTTDWFEYFGNKAKLIQQEMNCIVNNKKYEDVYAIQSAETNRVVYVCPTNIVK